MPNTIETLPMIFVDENGQPKIIHHQCDQARIGKPMTREERFAFGMELLLDYYRIQGNEIKDVNPIEDSEYPNIVMVNPEDEIYYVVVRASVFPENPIDIEKGECEEVIALAKEFNAKPVFAGISFACATSYHGSMKNLSYLLCGAEFFVAYRGLQPLSKSKISFKN